MSFGKTRFRHGRAAHEFGMQTHCDMRSQCSDPGSEQLRLSAAGLGLVRHKVLRSPFQLPIAISGKCIDGISIAGERVGLPLIRLRRPSVPRSAGGCGLAVAPGASKPFLSVRGSGRRSLAPLRDTDAGPGRRRTRRDARSVVRAASCDQRGGNRQYRWKNRPPATR